MDVPSYVTLIDKLHGHLEYLNGHLFNHKFKIEHTTNSLYSLILDPYKLKVGELIFYIDHLNIVGFENSFENSPPEPDDRMRFRLHDTFKFKFYYDNQKSFNYLNITKTINAITLISLFIRANDILRVLLEDDRYLAAMTATVDINTTLISKEMFDEFHIYVIKSVYGPPHALFCCYIIEEYFRYNKLIINKCRNIIDDNINIFTFPCLELGVPIKIS